MIQTKNVGDYTVYSDGRIYNNYTKHWLKTDNKDYNYVRVCLWDRKDNSRNSTYLHRLLAECFIPNPNPDVLTEVDHIDGNSKNNDLSNLRWVSRTENRKKRYKQIDYQYIQCIELPEITFKSFKDMSRFFHIDEKTIKSQVLRNVVINTENVTEDLQELYKNLTYKIIW